MIKFLFRISVFLIIIILLLIAYLSSYGLKTNKFNELIKTQIVKQDDRLSVNLNDVFIKFNIKERSFSLNSKNIDFIILNESQKIANVDILISLSSLIKRENKLKRIIINSKKNEIKDLLKFIRVYKINIPILYLEKSITKGDIVYDIIVDFSNKKFNQVKISGKLINIGINILGKENLENINFDFEYINQELEIRDLELDYKKIKFESEKIIAKLDDNLINIGGVFKNDLNLNLLSNIIDPNIKNFIDEQILLPTKSIFNITFNKKLKIRDYNLQSELILENLNINLSNINLKNYIANYENKILLNNGKLILNINKNKKLEIKINSKFAFNENQTPKNISLDYNFLEKFESYKFNIDLSENKVSINEIDFNKKKGEKFELNFTASKKENFFKLNNLNLFNNKNKFIIKNLILEKDLKIYDFDLIEANYYNKTGFLNSISINKNNSKINLFSKSLDISSNIEKSLKGSGQTSVLDIFKNLNSLLIINIKSAKLDDDHTLNELKGNAQIKNNKIQKANLSAKFDEKNVFLFTKDEIEGKNVTTIFSDFAKPFVKKFKFIRGFDGGKLDYTSTTINDDLSKSELRIYNFKLQDMPALTKLLSLASLQGIADLATGEGIRFNEFDMFFENSKNLITINEIYALGPAISILMEGYVEKNELVSLRGTLVPATTINKTIAKIPLLGNILVGNKMGEGVFGVSFKIKGHPKNLDTRVNPIKTLTPRFITRTLDKIKKTN